MASDSEFNEEVQRGLIERLQRRNIVELEQVRHFHRWLDDKRLSRQSGRVVGESRTGKTLSCEAYQLKYPPSPENGAMRVPIVYWQAVPDSSNRDLFTGLLEGLQYQIYRGTLSEIRSRVLHLLQICQVELLMVDEAHRLRSNALSELQDMLDKLQVAIILVGTDRLNAVLKRDEQVDRRFIASHQYARLSAAQLAQTSAIWETYVLKLPQASHLSSVKVQRLLAPATGGYIGLLDRILREAAVRSLRAGKPRVEFTILSEVVAECR